MPPSKMAAFLLDEVAVVQVGVEEGDLVRDPLPLHLLGDREVTVEVEARGEEVDALGLHLGDLRREIALPERQRRVLVDDVRVDVVGELLDLVGAGGHAVGRLRDAVADHRHLVGAGVLHDPRQGPPDRAARLREADRAHVREEVRRPAHSALAFQPNVGMPAAASFVAPREQHDRFERRVHVVLAEQCLGLGQVVDGLVVAFARQLQLAAPDAAFRVDDVEVRLDAVVQEVVVPADRVRLRGNRPDVDLGRRHTGRRDRTVLRVVGAGERRDGPACRPWSRWPCSSRHYLQAPSTSANTASAAGAAVASAYAETSLERRRIDGAVAVSSETAQVSRAKDRASS